MLRALRLTAALLAGLAVPAFALSALAQTTTPPAKPATPPPSSFTTQNRPPSATTGTTPAATTTPTPTTPPAPIARPATIPPTGLTPPARPATPTAATAAVPAAAGKRLDINGASETDLASLPGIGPVTAKNIVTGRPWDDLADLVKKKAMGQAVFDKNKDRFALANINTSSAADMAKTLPGIGDKTAPKIVNGRPYATPQELVTKKILTDAQFAKIKDLVTY